MTTINRFEFASLLRKHGWQQLRSEGNHQIWKHEDGRQERIAFPPASSNHGDIGEGLAKELLTRFGLSPKEGSTAQMLEGARQEAKNKPKAAPGSTLAPEGSFGRRVAEARIAKGWSQGELARRADITQGQISAWERGASSPIAADGHISFKHMKPRLAVLADLLGFRDILEKTGPGLREGPPKIVAAKFVAPAAVETPNVETDLDHELAALRKRHPDQKAFSKSLMRLLSVSDVMEWLIDQENIRRRQEVELEKYRREDAAGMRRKAQAYDSMRAEAEALLARMKEAE